MSADAAAAGAFAPLVLAGPAVGHGRIDAEPGGARTVKLYLSRHPGPVPCGTATAVPAAPRRAERGDTGLVAGVEPVVRNLIDGGPGHLGRTAFRAAGPGAGRD